MHHHITMGEARSHYGAKSVVISYSRLRLNETDLEDALQTKLQSELLGLERRCTATSPWAQSTQQRQLLRR
jgi:hypothetical protein